MLYLQLYMSEVYTSKLKSKEKLNHPYSKELDENCVSRLNNPTDDIEHAFSQMCRFLYKSLLKYKRKSRKHQLTAKFTTKTLKNLKLKKLAIRNTKSNFRVKCKIFFEEF